MLERSIDRSWLCGVWISGDELTAPQAKYFNFPQVFRTKCPIEKNTRKFARLCQKVGEKWEKTWSPDKRGVRGKKGDDVCKIVNTKLDQPDVPSEMFPSGVKLGYYYN